MALREEDSDLVLRLGAEGMRFISFSPRSRFQIAEVVLAEGVSALPVPWFGDAGEMDDGRICEQLCELRFGESGFCGGEAFTEEKVLGIPCGSDKVYFSAQYGVEQILVIVDDAFGVSGEIGRALGEYIVLSPLF